MVFRRRWCESWWKVDVKWRVRWEKKKEVRRRWGEADITKARTRGLIYAKNRLPQTGVRKNVSFWDERTSYDWLICTIFFALSRQDQPRNNALVLFLLILVNRFWMRNTIYKAHIFFHIWLGPYVCCFVLSIVCKTISCLISLHMLYLGQKLSKIGRLTRLAITYNHKIILHTHVMSVAVLVCYDT